MENKHLNVRIRITDNIMKKYADACLAEAYKLDITSVEAVTMAYLAKHGDSLVTSKDLIVDRKISKATVSQTLKSLSLKGYIALAPTEDDKRVKIINLTEKGNTLVSNMVKMMDSLAQKMEQGITLEERETFLRVLAKIEGNCGYAGK